MKAIILAAGQGTRLKKYTKALPKGMLEFGGKTLIERQIEQYRQCGIDKIIVVRGYEADKIAYENIQYYDNQDYLNTNMVVSFLCARPEFDEDVILSYSDILFSKKMLKEMMAAKDDFACAVDVKWQDYWKKRYGKVDFDTESLEIDGNGCITSLGTSDPPLSDIDARYIGLLKFSVAGLKKIAQLWDRDCKIFQNRPWQLSGKKIQQSYMTDLLNALIAEGNPMKAVPFKNGWIEFDTNEDYEKQSKWLEDGSLDQFITL